MPKDKETKPVPVPKDKAEQKKPKKDEKPLPNDIPEGKPVTNPFNEEQEQEDFAKPADKDKIDRDGKPIPPMPVEKTDNQKADTKALPQPPATNADKDVKAKPEPK